MSKSATFFVANVALLRASATHQAYLGAGIAIVAVLIATGLSDFLPDRRLSLEGLWQAQKENGALWLLDCMPFVFAIWGQHFGLVMANQAGALIMNQTEDLHSDNLVLKAQAQRNSNLDYLTSLPNRQLFLDRTEQAIAHIGGEDHRVGALVIDIDDFGEVNRAMGQHSGDRVLQSVAKRLRAALDEPATVARLGADSFAVLLPKIADTRALVKTARAINKSLEPPCVIDNVKLSIRASMGASVSPDHAMDAEQLLTHADLAMHEAKAGTNYFQWFKPRAGHEAAVGNLSMASELRQAIASNTLDLYVQPIVDYRNHEISGVEALLRWQHPRRGMLPPSEFIARAERSGLINDLTYWVMRETLALVQAACAKGIELQASVNISARTLMDPSFPDVMSGLLAAHDVSATQVTLEITEDTLMSEQHIMLGVISQLAGMGLRFSIDDFGTGYSQLSYLKQLPVAEVKIDQSFVRYMLHSDVDATIVEATVNLAHALDLQVVAEGVERLEQAQHLNALGCDFIQGYYIARPMPAAELFDWVAGWENALALDPRIKR